MERLDLYKVLEVSKDASQDAIRRSYRRLARKYHPDANPGDKKAEDRFKEIQHAYEVLSKPEKRREYDEGPRTFFGSGGTGRPGDAGFGDFSDLLGGFGNLGDIFGRTTTTQRTQAKGENLTVNIRLSFRDALNGVTTRVGVPVEEACGECGGIGAAPGTVPRTCPECGGRGVQSRDRGSLRKDAGGGASCIQAKGGRFCRRGARQLRRGGARGGDPGSQARWGYREAQVARRHAGRQAVQGEGRGGVQGQDGWGGERGPHRAGERRSTQKAQAAGA